MYGAKWLRLWGEMTFCWGEVTGGEMTMGRNDRIPFFLSGMQWKIPSGKCVRSRLDKHRTRKHKHGSWILCLYHMFDRKQCILCSTPTLWLHYSMLHRFEIFSAPETIAHGSISCRLVSSRGCSFAISMGTLRYPIFLVWIELVHKHNWETNSFSASCNSFKFFLTLFAFFDIWRLI